MSDLIDQGKLKIGDTLIWKRRSPAVTHSMRVLGPAVFQTEDEVLHKSPSGAARHLIGRPVDGWIVWRRHDGKSLADLRRD